LSFVLLFIVGKSFGKAARGEELKGDFNFKSGVKENG
jgi:hypothetical protein